MVYRIVGGIFILCLGLNYINVTHLPPVILGILGIVAGVALLAGV